MPRRLKISPLQRNIMMTLEEAGAETIGYRRNSKAIGSD